MYFWQGGFKPRNSSKVSNVDVTVRKLKFFKIFNNQTISYLKKKLYSISENREKQASFCDNLAIKYPFFRAVETKEYVLYFIASQLRKNLKTFPICNNKACKFISFTFNKFSLNFFLISAKNVF